MIDIIKDILIELVKKVPGEMAVIILLLVLIVGVLVWLFRKNCEGHIGEISSLTEAFQKNSDAINDFKSDVTTIIGNLKTTVELLIPMVVGKNNRAGGSDG